MNCNSQKFTKFTFGEPSSHRQQQCRLLVFTGTLSAINFGPYLIFWCTVVWSCVYGIFFHMLFHIFIVTHIFFNLNQTLSFYDVLRIPLYPPPSFFCLKYFLFTFSRYAPTISIALPSSRIQYQIVP